MTAALPHAVIGATSVAPTVLGMGTAPIGNLYRAIDDATAIDAIRMAWDCGVRYFDTAPHYGLGLAEQRLGAALGALPRQQAVVSTKVGRLLVANPTPSGSDLAAGFDVPDDLTRVRDYSRDGVRRSLEASLQRLELDYVDIAYVHDPDEHMTSAIDEALPALRQLRDEGVVRAIGVGMNHVEPVRRFVTQTEVDVVMVAGRWTLLDHSAGDLLDECQTRGVAVMAAAPFNSGLLARSDPDDAATFDYQRAPDALLKLARRYAHACGEHGVQLPHAAIQFPLRHPAITSVVVGLASAEQARHAADWVRTPIAAAVWAALDLDNQAGINADAEGRRT